MRAPLQFDRESIAHSAPKCHKYFWENKLAGPEFFPQLRTDEARLSRIALPIQDKWNNRSQRQDRPRFFRVISDQAAETFP